MKKTKRKLKKPKIDEEGCAGSSRPPPKTEGKRQEARTAGSDCVINRRPVEAASASAAVAVAAATPIVEDEDEDWSRPEWDRPPPEPEQPAEKRVRTEKEVLEIMLLEHREKELAEVMSVQGGLENPVCEEPPLWADEGMFE